MDSVSTAGDVNGDGYCDCLIGAQAYSNGETYEGRAYVYYGSSTGLSLTPDWTGESNQLLAFYGVSVSEAGDVNGDGYSDVIIGALWYDNGESNEGRAYVYYGSPTGLSLTPDWIGESNQANAHYGYSVSTAGDVNGDGYSDVIIGAYQYSNGETYEGCAYVYYGSPIGLSLTPDWIGESNQANAYYGISVSTTGDVNGDGYSDIIVGAYCYDNGEGDEGRAYVYYGNGNGRPIEMKQLRTDLTTPIVPSLLTYSKNSFGFSSHLFSIYGRILGKAEIEVKPLGIPFDGIELITTDWIDLGTSGYNLSNVISGLDNNRLYKWRLRVKYHPKYGSPIHSRWFYISGNAPNEVDFRTGLTGIEKDDDRDVILRCEIVKGSVIFHIDRILEGEIVIYNVLGVVIDRIKITKKDIIWNKEVPKGVYFASIVEKSKGIKFIFIK